MNLLDSLNTHSKICCDYLRVVLVFALFIAVLSFFSGCSTYKKPTPQPGELEYKRTGIASYYANKFQSRKTASGEIFNNNLMTAAHRTLPFGTNVVVKNLNNGKSVKVKINDRGPYIKRRIIDLSRAAFAKIENMNKGVTKVEIMVVD
jgi:rare lipoprotein A